MLMIKQLQALSYHGASPQQLDFSLRPGDILQILGNNGTGKTTLLRMVSGLIMPSRGTILWKNKNIFHQLAHYQSSLIYIGHRLGLNSSLTPYENLCFYQCATQHSSCQLEEVLAQVKLLAYKNTPLAKLSAGLQRRAALARLWLCQRPIWILDEPFTALDKESIQQLRDLFYQHLARQGMIILTSHQAVPMEHDRLRFYSLTSWRAMP